MMKSVRHKSYMCICTHIYRHCNDSVRPPVQLSHLLLPWQPFPGDSAVTCLEWEGAQVCQELLGKAGISVFHLTVFYL